MEEELPEQATNTSLRNQHETKLLEKAIPRQPHQLTTPQKMIQVFLCVPTKNTTKGTNHEGKFNLLKKQKRDLANTERKTYKRSPQVEGSIMPKTKLSNQRQNNDNLCHFFTNQ